MRKVRFHKIQWPAQGHPTGLPQSALTPGSRKDPGSQASSFYSIKCCKLHVEFSCQEDKLQPRVLLWFQRKATSMNKRFQRAYLRSWVQVKELGVGEAGFPFVRWIWALFFLLPFVRSRKKVLLWGSGLSSQHWDCGGKKRGAAWYTFPSVLRTARPPQCLIKTQVSQPGFLSPAHFQPSASFT